MPGSDNRLLYAAVALVFVAVIAYSVWPTGPQLTLTIEVTGGFAYVTPNPGDNHLNIAYLDSWTHEADLDPAQPGLEMACEVRQIGTEMKLIVGDIVDHEPKAKPLPPTREFDLDKAVVQFPAVEAANLPLSLNRTKFTDPPYEPADTEQPAEWKKNLKWIPSIKEHHAGSAIRPDWQDVVNGRMQLRGGEMVAMTPTNPKFKKAKLDFKQRGTSRVKTSATDKSIYTVQIPMSGLPGGNLEITLSNAKSGFTKLVIKPQGNKVELQLTGLHDMGAPDLDDGDPLTDFCAFYQLLHPMPDATDFLVPHFVKAPSVSSTAPNTNAFTAGGQPSPGLFCVPDWF